MFFYRKLRIRYKLLLSYSMVFILTISLGSFIQYFIVSKAIQSVIESELSNSTEALKNLVRTSVSVSIKNHLRAAAEKNRDIVTYFYGLYLSGELSEKEAKARATAVLLSQRIGTTGYIACVDSKGIMRVHPEKPWIDVDITQHEFVQEMIRKKNGYIEYNWQNPGESHVRPKAMYMSYFEPWDWIITVSSYQKEFIKLANISDFRKSVISFRFGQTGYSFVTDTKGNIIIHPELQGINIFEEASLPHQPMKSMVEQKSGKIIYDWKNPGDEKLRKKLVVFDYIPEYGWIVASSRYLNEFYSPLKTLNNVIVFSLLASLLLVLPLTFQISSSITKPLYSLMKRMDIALKSYEHQPQQGVSDDEIDQLTVYFDSFMDRLDRYSKSLKEEIHDRRQVEEALRISEEKYRSVMEATPDPTIVYDMEGRITYMNPAFTRFFGWTLDECLGKTLDHFVPRDNWEETRAGIKKLLAGQNFIGVETRRFTKTGKLNEVSLRGAVYRDKNGVPIGSVITHRDVSDLRRLEKQVMDIGDQERQKIGQDLHDDLCPHLIGIEGLLKVLKKKLDNKVPEESPLVVKITELIKTATSKTRRLARGLCPVYTVDHGLESSLRELAIHTESVFDINCKFDCTSPVPIKDNTAATHLFRITQEAIHNAIKHGKAKSILIELSSENRIIELKIIDNGVGIPDIIESDGMGLRIMRFRANIIEALLDIRREQAGGTVVQINLKSDSSGLIDKA